MKNQLFLINLVLFIIFLTIPLRMTKDQNTFFDSAHQVSISAEIPEDIEGRSKNEISDSFEIEAEFIHNAIKFEFLPFVQSLKKDFLPHLIFHLQAFLDQTFKPPRF